tara:strand:+ start:384 stop:767 length:384 start_codon:yes stop_codon:yes gene_type:complete
MLVGQAGEFIAASALIQIGVQVMLSPTQGADLLAYDDGKYWRVEVKTTKRPESADRKIYRFNTTRGSAQKVAIASDECDVVALVALERRRVFFRNIKEIKSKSTRLSINRFVEGCEMASWKEAISWT